LGWVVGFKRHYSTFSSVPVLPELMGEEKRDRELAGEIPNDFVILALRSNNCSKMIQQIII
jgi:hypothetical protein